MRKIRLKDLLAIANCYFDVWIVNEETEEFFYGACGREDVTEYYEDNDKRVLNAEVKHFDENIIVVYIKDYVDESQQW